MDSQVQVEGRLLDIITDDWRKEKLTLEDIAVPLSELPPPESDSATPTETVRQLESKWLDLNLSTLAEALATSGGMGGAAGDDTGVSEIVLSSGNFKEDLRIMADTQGLPSFKECISEDEDEDEDGVGGRSPDFRGGQTRILQPTAATKHSNKVEKQKTCDRPARTVVWKKGNVDSTEDLEQIFPRKQLDVHQEQGSDEVDGAQQANTSPPKVSLLSHLIENMSVQDANPWLDYAKFDATGNLDLKITRKIRMFYPCTTSTEEDKGRGYPVDITCYRDIGVSDLLGLALFHYTQQRRQPAQLPPLENHCLCMCDEEDGLVDSDFPPLITSDPLAKYGFSVLALVPAAVQRQSSTSSSTAGDNASNAFCVTLHMPDGTFSQIEIQDKTMTLGELTSLGLERRKYLQKAKYKFNYHLEAPDVHGVALDPKQTLSSQDGNSEFYIVRDNSKRVSDLQSTGTLPNFLEADLYQSFNVEIFTKVRTKVDIHLGISGEKVEIDPRQQASSAKFWSRQKAVSYAMDKVVSCEILKKSKVVGSGSPAGDMNPRVVFRMVYLSDSGWGHKDFESDREVAEEVVQKLNYLLDQKQSTARDNRREYLQNKQKKRERIRTLTN